MNRIINLVLFLLIIGLFVGTGYCLLELDKASKLQSLIVPNISSYTIKAEVTSVTTGEDGEITFYYKVIEANSPRIRIHGTGSGTTTPRLNHIQKEDLNKVGAILIISCFHEGEQMYCSQQTERFTSEFIQVKYIY